MNSFYFLKVLEYLLLPHLERHLPVHENQFAYQTVTGCIDAITVEKDRVMYYNAKGSDVYCAMLDLSKVYDRINTSLLFDKMRETELPGQVNALIDFMGKNTFVSTCYGGHMSDECNAKNGVKQGGISSEILFKLYLNELIYDISMLQAGCTLNCNRVNILE